LSKLIVSWDTLCTVTRFRASANHPHSIKGYRLVTCGRTGKKSLERTSTAAPDMHVFYGDEPSSPQFSHRADRGRVVVASLIVPRGRMYKPGHALPNLMRRELNYSRPRGASPISREHYPRSFLPFLPGRSQGKPLQKFSTTYGFGLRL